MDARTGDIKIREPETEWFYPNDTDIQFRFSEGYKCVGATNSHNFNRVTIFADVACAPDRDYVAFLKRMLIAMGRSNDITVTGLTMNGPDLMGLSIRIEFKENGLSEWKPPSR